MGEGGKAGVKVGGEQRRSPHCDDSVQVVPDSLGVGGEQVGLGGLHARILNYGLHGCEDLLLLIEPVDVGNIASIQDVVDVLQERLALDLKEAQKTLISVR